MIAGTAEPRVTHLRTDHLDAPIALTRVSPGFSWRIEAPGRAGLAQAAYRIVIADVASAHIAADTGVVSSDTCIAVRVPGFEGRPGADYRWRVDVWLAGVNASLNAASTFGIAHRDWVAPWIEPRQERVVAEGPTNPRPDLVAAACAAVEGVPLTRRLHPPRRLRDAFTLRSLPRRAVLRITSQGIYSASVNGRAVDDALLGPGYESYELSMPVVSHDVTALLAQGPNVLGIGLADGWWAGRISFLGRSAQYGDMLRASWQLELDHHDGSHETLTPAAPAVMSARGPIDWSDLFIGERRDARLDEPGWDATGFVLTDSNAWTPCAAVPFDAPVHPFHGEPVRRLMSMPAQRVWTAPNGDVLADFGQVLAGRVRLHVRGPRGTVVRLEHAEALGPDGNLAMNIIGFAKDQADEYVLAGNDSGETWEPEFTFHGFRYVRIIGWPGYPAAEDLTAVVIGSELETTADLHTSDPRIDQLFRNTVWSQRSNFLAVPTDCPQRERAGYTGDMQIFAETAATLMGVAAFIERWLADLRRDQVRRGGGVSVIVPEPPAMSGDFGAGTIFGEIRTPAGWADAITIVPWALYRHSGDRRFLEDNIEGMRAWVAFQSAQAAARNPAELDSASLSPERAARHTLLWNGGRHFGDWLAPSTMVGFDEHPGDAILRAPLLTSEIVGPAFQVLSLQLLARAEAELGNEAAAAGLESRLKAVRGAFAAEYLGDDGSMSPDLQGLYVLALAFDLAPEGLRPRLVARLVELVHRAGDHLDTGFLSVPYLLDVLWDHGERDLARTLLLQDTAPSWLYEVAMGATTIWEAWHAVHEDGSVEPVSLNHYAFGCAIDWVMRRQAGIELTSPGYRTTRIAPDFGGPLTSCAAHIDTPYGRLAVDWHCTHERATLVVEVPVGVTAHVALPDRWSTREHTTMAHGRHTLNATRT